MILFYFMFCYDLCMAKSKRMRRVRNPDGELVAAQPSNVAAPSQTGAGGSSKAPIILLAGVASVALVGAAWWFMIGRHDQSRFVPADQRTATYLDNKAREEARFAAAAESQQRRTSTSTPQAGNVTNTPFQNANHLEQSWFISHFSGPRPVPTAGDTSINVNDRDTIEAVQRVLMGLGYRRNGESTCATGDAAHCRITPSGVVDDNMRESLRLFMTVENPTVTGISRETLATHTADPIHPDVFYAVARYVANRPGYFWTEGTDEARTMAMLSKFYVPITAPARGLGNGAYAESKCGSPRAIRHIVVSSRRKRP